MGEFRLGPINVHVTQGILVKMVQYGARTTSTCMFSKYNNVSFPETSVSSENYILTWLQPGTKYKDSVKLDRTRKM